MNKVQDQVLSALKEKETMITLFLVNGFQYRGKIVDFDKFTLSLEADGQLFVISKKMVSTIQTTEALLSKKDQDGF
ncbi:RNA chaperone Hfq [Thermoactinomyces mirandus]|uniref:RNA chaperone Hfq n=1 Tax=Thermoactinomyces mirandus TaxID=2756294 RepID=A0A7W1XUH1_9BACL|nr:RNA chaperone Hfq [Thermoactinomyces mirandus]MBA4603220.1 RNA chaperone Hfq [Thermoactinomyces mirandus]